MIDTEGIMKIGLELANWKKLPYDSAIHVRGKNIRKVLLTIDVTVGSLILAKSMQCDAVVGHHPIGIAALKFHRVFDRHIDYMISHNIPKEIAEHAVMKLKAKTELRSHASIYNDVVSAAKILKMPLLNIHQPCDEYMRKVILSKINSARITYVGDIVRCIEELPEFKNAATRVKVRYGSAKNLAGRWALVVAAGTNGGSPIAKAYFDYGVRTVIYLHIDYTDLTKLYEENLKGNLIVLGHLAGDSIGLNALADKLENKKINVVKLGIIHNAR